MADPDVFKNHINKLLGQDYQLEFLGKDFDKTAQMSPEQQAEEK